MNLTLYIYLSLIAIVINLVALNYCQLQKTRFAILLNSLFFAAISNITLWNIGIYIDEHNLNGSHFVSSPIK